MAKTPNDATRTLSKTKTPHSPVGLGPTAAQSWRRFAEDKRAEFDERIERMRTLLGTLSGCGCPTLKDCGRTMHAGSRC